MLPCCPAAANSTLWYISALRESHGFMYIMDKAVRIKLMPHWSRMIVKFQRVVDCYLFSSCLYALFYTNKFKPLSAY